ncbi:hypothetical protein V2J09_013388 [Rumex salicifolius]
MMFFSGDSSTRKRVDLGGRSSKERDRQKLLEQTRLERNRRFFQRQQNSSAIKIQKCFRGRKAVEAERSKLRQQFFRTYGGKCQIVNRHCFGPDSEFLRQLLFFFNARNSSDVSALVETCRLLQHDAVTLFAGLDHSLERHLVDYRVKQLTYACIQTINTNRITSKEELFLKPQHSDSPTVVLLEAVKILIDPELPWACKTVGHLINKNMFSLLREIVLSGKGSMGAQTSAGGSSLEHVLALTICHIGEGPCICQNVDSRYSFSSQILTIPFLWKTFPNLREVFGMPGLNTHYIHQMALCVRNHTNALPSDTSAEFPGYACLLGNILEANSFALSQTVVLFDLAVDFVDVATFLLGLLPPLKSVVGHYQDGVIMEDDETTLEACNANVLNVDLEKQISNAIDSQFIIHLTNVLFGGLSLVDLDQQGPRDKELAAVGSACAFLHVAFNSLPLEHNLTTLTYRTGLVAVLWKFMKLCHESNKWSALSEHSAYLSDGAPGWLLPLAVFCPIYKHMLMVVDNEEFYEQEKPLSLNDLRYLIVILKQALWQLLWVNPTSPLSLAKSVMDSFVLKKLPLEYLQYRVSIVASELLSQLQDWNNRRQFSPPSYFHADGINEYFISQAMQENSRASEVLKLAPSLVPFTSRVKIYASQLDAARRRDSSHSVFARNRLKIRRDHILEDAFNRISALSDEDLHGVIRVTYVNEFGAEEAGIDGGGIFKDFMENITRAAFDVQYGLFKESPGHLLYPNPGSGLIHEQHLQFFHFVGTILAKAMFEGILVDIPFATFFLSKLKQKHNYLNDLTSLDPEMYRHLIFLKHYKGDISELELYFVVVNNEYGEQVEEELIPQGKTIRVTNENVIRFIHLMANHRLNCQIRHQSSHFLRGFQQLIRKDWIDMFNEHELQILISGSVDGLDLDDLRTHAQYSGGYHAEHYVIEIFWEVIKGFSQENQMKFVKFVTGCSRGPLLGFKCLEPPFCIQRAAGDASDEAFDRLPTAATCMNLLKLPPYQNKEQLESKLLYAISAEAGFDLS